MPALLLRYLPHLAALAVLIIGAIALHHKWYGDGLDKGRAELAAYVVRSQQEALEARQKALDAVTAEAAVREGEAEKARQRAANEAAAWRKRYNEARRTPECASWAAEAVQCPLPIN